MNRTAFLVDGFNLYHSIRDIGRYLKLNVKWLNLYSLCASFLPLISKDATLELIFYFSAYAAHLNDPNVIKRHENYIECLISTGIIPEMGRFKPKDVTCPSCSNMFKRYEEKETDVAIASKLFELSYNNKCDTIILVTGDTDLAPAVRITQHLFPNVSIRFAFPFRRMNNELAQIAPNSFKISKDSYIRHQFPNPVTLKDGSQIYKPSTW